LTKKKSSTDYTLTQQQLIPKNFAGLCFPSARQKYNHYLSSFIITITFFVFFHHLPPVLIERWITGEGAHKTVGLFKERFNRGFCGYHDFLVTHCMMSPELDDIVHAVTTGIQ